VYRRADLWRTFVLVVAPLLTAASTGDFARGFLASDPYAGMHSTSPLSAGRVRGVERI